MAKFTLNFTAYHNVKWQTIADDLIHYVNLFIDRRDKVNPNESYEDWKNKVEVLNKKIREHQRMFEHKGFTEQSEAIEQFPPELKTEIKTFSRNLAKVTIAHKKELAEWDILGLDEKVSLLQKITNQFLKDNNYDCEVPINLDSARSMYGEDNSVGSGSYNKLQYEAMFATKTSKGVKVSRHFLSQESAFILPILCHELWHEVLTITCDYDKIKAEGFKSPAQVLKALNEIHAGYITTELSETMVDSDELYALQVAELCPVASEAYFKQALRNLSKTGAQRSRD